MFSFTDSVMTEIRRHQSSSPWTYSDLDQRQREIAEKVRAGCPGTLLLSEVAPVITHGKRTPSRDILLDRSELRQLGIAVHPTDRGGFATYHGPGQWVLFPVDSLEALTGDRRGVRRIVDLLLGIALRVGQLYAPDAHIRSGCEMGVWTSRGKFAAVGIHIEQGVLLHGLSVNGYRTSTSFTGLRPCGLDAPVDFLLNEPSEAEFQEIGNLLMREAIRSLWCQKNSIKVDSENRRGYKAQEAILNFVGS